MNNIFKRLVKFYENHGWCRGAFARDKHRHEAHPCSKKAANFCILGAAMKLGKNNEESRLKFISKGITNVSEWNDSFRNKKQIVKELKKYAKN